LLFKITHPDKAKDADKQNEGGGHKIDEKKLAEIPIKARGLLDMDDEVVYILFVENFQLCSLCVYFKAGVSNA